MPMLVTCPACSQQLRVSDALVGKRVRCSACKEIFEAKAAGDTPAAPPGEAPSGGPPLERDDSAGSGGLGNGVGIKLTLDDDPPPTPAETSADKTSGSDPAPENKAETPRKERRPKLSGFSDDLVACPACGAQVHKDLDECNRCGAAMKKRKRRGRDEDDDEDDDTPSRSRRSRRSRRDDDDDDDDAPRRYDWEPHRGGLILTLGVVGLVMSMFCGIGAIPGLIGWVMGHGDLNKINGRRMDPEGRGATMAGYVCSIIATCVGGLFLLTCGGQFCLGVMMGINESSKQQQQFNNPPPVIRPFPARKF